MANLWHRCFEALKYQVSDSEFNMWFKPLDGIEQGDNLLIYVTNKYFYEVIHKKYLALITDLVKKFEPNREITIVLQINDSNGDEQPLLSSVTNPSSTATSKSANINKGKNTKIKNIVPQIEQKFTFHEFVTGKNNQLAYGASKRTAQNLGNSDNNPLFLYGATGLGKTHLMKAVAHEVEKQNKTYRYFSSDNFVKKTVSAIMQSTIGDFKDEIKKADLIIIDDIHVLVGKNRTMVEFLALLNECLAENRQIILASDKHPSVLEGFDDYAKSRFLGGIVASVEPPELEVRIQILQKKAKLHQVELPRDCTVFIAQNVVANVRELEGALNTVISLSRTENRPISIDLVEMALKDVVSIRHQAINIENICNVVANFYEISVKDLKSKKRSRQIARPRQIAMSLTRELTSQSYVEIGNFLDRDHTTVMHACENVRLLCQADATIESDYKTLKLMLQS